MVNPTGLYAGLGGRPGCTAPQRSSQPGLCCSLRQCRLQRRLVKVLRGLNPFP